MLSLAQTHTITLILMIIAILFWVLNGFFYGKKLWILAVGVNIAQIAWILWPV